MTSAVAMTEAELMAAQERTDVARAQGEADRLAAAQSHADRIARGEVVRDPDVALDQRRPPPGDPGVTTREEFEAENEARANLDIIMGLREVEGAELVRWQIYRLSDPTGRKATGYLTEWGTDLLSTHRLQEEFGSGTYKVVGRHSAGGRFAGQRTVKIAEDPKTGNVSQPLAVPEQSQGSSSMQEMMVMFAQQAEQRRQEDAERERREEAREERRRQDRKDMMQIFAPVIAAVAPALFSRGPDLGTLIAAMKPDPQPTLLETMAALKALAPAPAPPQENAFQAGLKIFDAISDRVGNGKGESGWLDVAREGVRAIAPTVGPIVGQLARLAHEKQAQQQRHPPSAPPQVAQRPAPIAPPLGLPDGMSPPPRSMDAASSSAPDAQTDSGEIHSPQDAPMGEGDQVGLFQTMKLIPWLRRELDMLVSKASRASNPNLYAEVVLDSIPDDIDGDVLLDFLKKPDWFQTMAAFDNRVTQYEDWFLALRNEIILTGEDIKAEAATGTAPAKVVEPVVKPVTVSTEVDKPGLPPKLI